MKLKELIKKYGNVELTEEKEKELIKLLEIKKSKKWKPETNMNYYYIYEEEICVNTWRDFKIDHSRNRMNNVFRTKEEAKFRLEQIKVYNELKNFADENNDEIDWNNKDQLKYHIAYDYDDKCLIINICRYNQYIGQIYFSSEELANQAIETIGKNRIEKYLFGVNDDEYD